MRFSINVFMATLHKDVIDYGYSDIKPPMLMHPYLDSFVMIYTKYGRSL